MRKFWIAAALAAGVAGLAIVVGTADAAKLKGKVRIDGSSTVFPITEAVAEEFGAEQPRVRVTVGVSGTGGGFKKFLAGETDINNASRPIKGTEVEKSKETGVAFIELPVAFDGVTVVASKQNDFLDKLTVEELHRIWSPESTVKTWQDVRPEWPARKIRLYAPGVDSGTFDYFTEAINGKSQACRSDFTASEDDNVLVQGIAGDVDALGFFGFAYYVENADKLKVVPVDGGSGPVVPTLDTIRSGEYAPLSRPLFLYVTEPASHRPEVQEFVRFYIGSATSLVGEVGYVPLPESVYDLTLARFEKRVTGSVFEGRDTVGVKLEDLLAIQ